MATRSVPGLYPRPGKMLSLGIAAQATQTRRSKMPGSLRSTAGSVDDRKLAGLIEPVIAAAGMDLESVRMTVAGKRRLLRIAEGREHRGSLREAGGVRPEGCP